MLINQKSYLRRETTGTAQPFLRSAEVSNPTDSVITRTPGRGNRVRPENVEMFMTTTQVTMESIQSQIAHAIGTANTRTSEEHLELLADLLAEAFNAVRVDEN